MKITKYYKVVIEYMLIGTSVKMITTSENFISYFDALFWKRKTLKQLNNDSVHCKIKKINLGKEIIYVNEDEYEY